jgi:hypothetical protein
MTLTSRYQRSTDPASLPVDAVQLTTDNLWQVYEWADSKPFYGPKQDGDTRHPITGLTVFTANGRVKAEFGDWVYRTGDGRFDTASTGAFAFLYAPVEAVTQ